MLIVYCFSPQRLFIVDAFFCLLLLLLLLLLWLLLLVIVVMLLLLLSLLWPALVIDCFRPVCLSLKYSFHAICNIIGWMPHGRQKDQKKFCCLLLVCGLFVVNGIVVCLL